MRVELPMELPSPLLFAENLLSSCFFLDLTPRFPLHFDSKQANPSSKQHTYLNERQRIL